MEIFRIQPAGREAPCYAVGHDGSFFPFSDACPYGEPPPRLAEGSQRLSPSACQVLAPVAPGKIVCVGRNYAAHARELGNEVPAEPKLFLKPPSSVVGPESPIVRPVHMSQLVHHEGELAVVLGRRLSHATQAEAAMAIFGYTIANDVTARDVQRAENAFTRAKGFDTFCPLGPCVVTADALSDPQCLDIRVRVDGDMRQEGNTRDMVFSVLQLLAWVSEVMTLEAGDVVLTGTPEGVGPLVAGNRVSVEIPGIGCLENPVVDAPWPPPAAAAEGA